ncbi:hypothetical protein FACS1894166_00290 [Bacilli bacterium]|nr:hypothetical protein FACS1894166_00290 [Bacilli bacterium]
MAYNKSVKKVTTVNAQIERIEFEKAQASKEFKIKFIAEARPKPPTLRELIEQLVVDMADIKSRVSALENKVSVLENNMNQKFKQLKIDNNLN